MAVDMDVVPPLIDLTRLRTGPVRQAVSGAVLLCETQGWPVHMIVCFAASIAEISFPIWTIRVDDARIWNLLMQDKY